MYKLKRAEISQNDLLRTYLSIIRPTVEYACSVWQTNLPGYLSDGIKVVQKRALGPMYPGVSYSEAMGKSKVENLFDRREELCTKYFTSLKCKDHKFHHFIPHVCAIPT